ncbi:Major facilitator superfamily domain general substrate transporter [Penicillium coprophilum]|uniref:Major facilitator superfamily domain general substrate transporter n=1 Tax=Penicillium coprophilum TaxID=36646 RepID=UPI0023867E49|nr:Major facilitator superfamily domain general substrate transporter [Penicillium coprophilum]KAJ5150585.1 Major facilitator superfamily domain general substrate transporter [Penicillium coprophilum]
MVIMSRFHRIVGNKSAETEVTSLDDPSALQVRADDKEAGHASTDGVTGKEETRPADNA